MKRLLFAMLLLPIVAAAETVGPDAQLTWDWSGDINTISGFRMYCNDQKVFEGKDTLINLPLTEAGDYSCFVLAYRDNETSGPSNTLNFTLEFPLGEPDSPVNLRLIINVTPGPDDSVYFMGDGPKTFDGVDDRVDLGNLDISGDLTISARFITDDPTDAGQRNSRLVSKATGMAADDHVFMLSLIDVGQDARLRARLKVGNSTATLIAGGGDIQAGQWHTGTMTHDGQTLRLYLDGSQVGFIPLAGTVAQDPSVAVAIGAQPAGAGDGYFKGQIDDVLILNRALTANEIM